MLHINCGAIREQIYGIAMKFVGDRKVDHNTKHLRFSHKRSQRVCVESDGKKAIRRNRAHNSVTDRNNLKKYARVFKLSRLIRNLFWLTSIYDLLSPVHSPLSINESFFFVELIICTFYKRHEIGLAYFRMCWLMFGISARHEYKQSNSNRNGNCLLDF